MRTQIKPDDLDPNCLTPCSFSWKIFLKKLILKQIVQNKLHPDSRVLSNLFACCEHFHAFYGLLIFFQNQHFQNILSGIPSECQTDWIQIVRPDLGPNCQLKLLADDTRRAIFIDGGLVTYSVYHRFCKKKYQHDWKICKLWSKLI